jgi:hypothetical protein
MSMDHQCYRRSNILFSNEKRMELVTEENAVGSQEICPAAPTSVHEA